MLKGVDGRDKPGHDDGWVVANGRWYEAARDAVEALRRQSVVTEPRYGRAIPSRRTAATRDKASADGSDKDRPTCLSISLARVALWSSSQRPNAGGDSAGA
jgi:hypothetical protein